MIYMDNAATTMRKPESVIEAQQDDYSDMRRFFIYGESLEFDALMLKIKELQKIVTNCIERIKIHEKSSTSQPGL